MNSRLYELLQVFSSIHELNDELEIQQTLLQAFPSVLTTVRCSIMLLDEQTDELVLTASVNLPETFLKAIHRIPNGAGSCGDACKNKQLRIISDMQRDKLWQPFLKYSEEANLRSVWSVPITYRDICFGSFGFYDVKVSYPTEDDVMLATWAAKQVAVALYNARFIKRQKQERMDIISSFVHAVERRDFYTYGHSQHVAEYAKVLGEAIGLPEDELDKLYNGGLLHDIGKILIPDRVLLKPGKLTQEEYEIIKEHPIQGVNMIQHIASLQEYLPIVRHHHERLDGKGYPDGLKGENIPLLARIVCIADAFDAMTSKRVYRSNMPFQTALEELVRCSGTQFDPDLVAVFVKIIPEKYPDFKRSARLKTHNS
jgi:putative nucleotidyltransferase with HDIG domain